MRSQELLIEELLVEGGMVQAWGTIAARPFQFRAKHGVWDFAVFEDRRLGPWDRDYPTEDAPGMHIVQRYTDEPTREDAEGTIVQCAEAYVRVTASS